MVSKESCFVLPAVWLISNVWLKLKIDLVWLVGGFGREEQGILQCLIQRSLITLVLGDALGRPPTASSSPHPHCVFPSSISISTSTSLQSERRSIAAQRAKEKPPAEGPIEVGETVPVENTMCHAALRLFFACHCHRGLKQSQFSR